MQHILLKHCGGPDCLFSSCSGLRALHSCIASGVSCNFWPGSSLVSGVEEESGPYKVICLSAWLRYARWCIGGERQQAGVSQPPQCLTPTLEEGSSGLVVPALPSAHILANEEAMR